MNSHQYLTPFKNSFMSTYLFIRSEISLTNNNRFLLKKQIALISIDIGNLKNYFINANSAKKYIFFLNQLC